MKKYIAKTNVSINIVLPSGKNRHITFDAVTGGGSVFYTDDQDIINAMERHYKYGTLFRADHQYNAEKQGSKPIKKLKPETASQPVQTPPVIPVAKPEPVEEVKEAQTAPESEQPDATDTGSEPQCEEEESDNAEAEECENGLRTIVVTDPDAAKSYLAEHFGYSRTKIKTLKAIKDAATANGIVFEGI